MESVLLLLLLRRICLFRPPVVIWEVPWSPGWRYRELISKAAVPRADLCVVFSTNQIELLKEKFGEQTRCRFIPFCVDTDFFRPRTALNRGYVYSVGRDPGRDFGIIVELAERVDVKVKIRTNLTLKRKPGANVEIISSYLSYPEYRDLYDGAEIVVIATHITPNSSGVTSLLEAMAMAKPVVVTANPSLKDYLPPGDAGIVVPAHDPDALQAAIVWLRCNPAAATAMGFRARQFVVSHFSLVQHFEAYADMLENDLSLSR